MVKSKAKYFVLVTALKTIRHSKTSSMRQKESSLERRRKQTNGRATQSKTTWEVFRYRSTYGEVRMENKGAYLILETVPVLVTMRWGRLCI
jgi:hypothetical protein